MRQKPASCNPDGRQNHRSQWRILQLLTPLAGLGFEAYYPARHFRSMLVPFSAWCLSSACSTRFMPSSFNIADTQPFGRPGWNRYAVGGRLIKWISLYASDEPGMRVSENHRLYMLSRLEHVEQRRSVDEPLRHHPHQFGEVGIVMADDDRRLVGMRVEGLGQPGELRGTSSPGVLLVFFSESSRNQLARSEAITST